ncbi:MAG: glycosyltransferase [Gemmataceae bacterium]|nr:glycosyltransferase [Gemmataceae bacterium]MDW8263728.1 glycosyltransferase [Gemmataceae bacterium]
MPRISLCVIVRDEEANLPSCLAAAADLVEEMIVVDTGSTDRSREVAASWGARVVDFPWSDSFAAARNEGLRHAAGDWIFWLDADDRIDETNRAKLRRLFPHLSSEVLAYGMICQSPPDSLLGWTRNVLQFRLFRRHPRLRWRYRIHEQLTIHELIDEGLGRIQDTDIVIQHVGYLDPDRLRGKQQRNRRLLELDFAENPEDPHVLLQVGWSLVDDGRPADALPLLQRALARAHPQDTAIIKLYNLVVLAYTRLGRCAEALEVAQRGLQRFPDETELLYQQALLRMGLGDAAGAEACFRRLLTRPEPPYVTMGVDPALRGWLARYNLGVLYRDQGRHAEAGEQWRAVVREKPDYASAWLGLAEVCLTLGRWPELEEVARQLEQLPGQELAAECFRARGAMARREYALARQRLEAAIARWPAALEPRILYSHALLQEGRDWQAAERALRDILALDPTNRQAQHNWAVLRELLAQQRPPSGVASDPGSASLG